MATAKTNRRFIRVSLKMSLECKSGAGHIYSGNYVSNILYTGAMYRTKRVKAWPPVSGPPPSFSPLFYSPY